MSNTNNQHDARLERAGGMFPPLVKIEDDDLPMELLHLPALRAVVPLDWALPAGADVDEVTDHATRLMQAYEAADRDTLYWTTLGAVAGLFYDGDRIWLAVVPDIGGDPNPFVPEMSWHWSSQVWLGDGMADEQAEALVCWLLAVGLSRDDPVPMAWRQHLADDRQGSCGDTVRVSQGIWSIELEQTPDMRLGASLSTDCFRLFRGDPSAETVSIPFVLDELGRAVAAVSALCGAQAGVLVKCDPYGLMPLRIRALSRAGRSGLLTPEEAVRRITREFPGSRLSKWVWPSDNNSNNNNHDKE